MIRKLVACSAALAASAPVAALAQYTPGPTVVVSPSTVVPGGGSTVSGQNCGTEGTPVIVVVQSGTGGSTVAGPGGNYAVGITAPSAPGTYAVTVSCGGAVAGASLTVGGSGNGGGNNSGGIPVAELPYTGRTSLPLIAGGATLVVGGVVLVGVSRRRRTALTP